MNDLRDPNDQRSTVGGDSFLTSLAKQIASFATRDDQPEQPAPPTLKNSIDSSDATPPLPAPAKRAVGRRQWETWYVSAGDGDTGTIHAGAQPDHWIVYAVALSTATVRLVQEDNPPPALPTAAGTYPAFGVVLSASLSALTIPGRGRSLSWHNEGAAATFAVIAVTNLTAGAE